MLFYRVTGTILNKGWKKKYNDRQEMEIISDNIQEKTEVFNTEIEDYIFVEKFSSESINIAVIMLTFGDVKTLVKDFLNNIEFEISDMKIEEIKLAKFREMSRNADTEFIRDDDEMFEKIGIEPICNHYRLDGGFDENVISTPQKKKLYEMAPKCMCDNTLIPELDRIFEIPNKTGLLAHPVHYVFNTDVPEIRKNLNRVLVGALYKNGRIKSKRYSFTKFNGNANDMRLREFRSLYKSCIGGVVISRFELPGTESNIATGEYDFLEDFCEVIREYQNEVLTILTFPKNNSNVKNFVFSNLQSMSFVEIEEDLSDAEKSIDYLKTKAQENHIRIDKRLTNKIESDHKYYTRELNEIFDEWYHLKLKDTIYSQYKEFNSVAKKVVKEETKGSAHNELTEMIGLDEAKKIIEKALDYYKAQKVFKEKGMSGKNPAMHMVFTGNPGSAKTSVARLFARILRENRVMSKGHMIEVGRADLVGKFVGWTAPLIKKKFAEAKGGVLFIDEAYSLVDDSGTYGDEAINTIVQEMENNREDVVVIFAGYPKEMEKFLNKNPGLRSRIAFHVPFDDYNTDELCDIAKLMAKKDGMELTDDALVKLRDIFDFFRKSEDFGNGRFVRNVLENARMSQASRLVKMDFDEVLKKDLRTIKACDIEMPANYKKKENKQNSIGFVS